MWLTGEGAYYLDTRYILLQLGGEVPEGVVYIVKESGDALAKVSCHHHHWDERKEGDDCQRWVANDQNRHNPNREHPQLDDLYQAISCKGLDRAHILDAAVDQLTGGAMVVISEGQVLDAVIHNIPQVVTYMCPDPFGQITLAQIQDGSHDADTNQDQCRTDQEISCPGFQTLVNHTLDDLRYYQRETGDAQQDEYVEQDFPEIGFEISV